MTFWINALFVFFIMLPYFINGVLATYMVDSVLKYEVKHKKFVYLILALAGTIYGIFAAITSVSGSGTNIIIDLMDMMMIYGSAIIVLAININAKWWKKILIAFLAIDILTSVNHIFDILSDHDLRFIMPDDVNDALFRAVSPPVIINDTERIKPDVAECTDIRIIGHTHIP